jgi:hypothetical protein
MSKEMAELVDRIAELPPEKRREFLIFGHGFVAGVELAAAEKTGDDLPAACGDPAPLSGEAGEETA